MAQVFDPVCGMTIEDGDAVARSDFEGQTIYFCAIGCKRSFDQDPDKFMVSWREHSS